MQVMRMVGWTVAAFALCLFLAPTAAFSQIPQTISYQGVLATADDPPEIVPDDDYDLTFKLYDVEEEGTAVWTEVHVGVPVEEGRFHVILGRGLPFTNVAFDKPYWLGITVGTGTELPRIELTASPYCLTARLVENDAVTTLSIDDGTILFADIGQNAAEEGDAITWDGEAWVPTSIGATLACADCDDRFVNVTGDEIEGTLSLRKPADDVNLILKKSTGEPEGSIKVDETLNLITYHANSRSHDFESEGAAICAFFDAAIQVTGDITATGTITGDIDHGGLDGLDGDDHPQYVLDAGDEMTGMLAIQRPADTANILLKKSDGTDIGYIQAEEAQALITYHGEGNGHNFESGGASICALFDSTISVTGDIVATGAISGDIDHGGLDGLDGDDHPQYVHFEGDSMTGTLTIRKPETQANLVLKTFDGTALGYIQAEETKDLITYHGNDVGHNFESGTAPKCATFDGDVDVNGVLCTTDGNVVACSDARYKKDVEELECALNKVSSLRGVTYRWRQDEFPKKNFDGNVHHGFIAQEIQRVLPDVVHEDSQGYLAVDYSRVTPLLVEAIKEQQKQIDELRAMIEQLLASR